jgi:hypothetical protein
LKISSRLFAFLQSLKLFSALASTGIIKFLGAFKHLFGLFVRVYRMLIAFLPALYCGFADVGNGSVAFAFHEEGFAELLYFRPRKDIGGA